MVEGRMGPVRPAASTNYEAGVIGILLPENLEMRAFLAKSLP